MTQGYIARPHTGADAAVFGTYFADLGSSKASQICTPDAACMTGNRHTANLPNHTSPRTTMWHWRHGCGTLAKGGAPLTSIFYVYLFIYRFLYLSIFYLFTCLFIYYVYLNNTRVSKLINMCMYKYIYKYRFQKIMKYEVFFLSRGRYINMCVRYDFGL